MGYYSGGDGKMKIGSVEVATVTTWSFTASQETLDVTTLGDRDRKLVGGTRSISGSASISWYSASGASTSQTQAPALIGNLIKLSVGGATPVASDVPTFTLGITDHAGTAKEITFSVILTSIAMTSSQGEILSAEVSFEASDVPSALTLDEV